MLDTLQNFAEVGVAVMGFSGIVAAVYSRSEQLWTPRERDHLISLLQTSAMVIAFALIPQVLLPAFGEGRSLWVVANSLYAFVHLMHYLVTARKMKRAISRGHSYAIRKRDAYASGIVASALIVAQVGVVFIGNVDQMHFAYLAILLWHTFSAAAMFCALLIRVIPKVKK